MEGTFWFTWFIIHIRKIFAIRIKTAIFLTTFEVWDILYIFVGIRQPGSNGKALLILNTNAEWELLTNYFHLFSSGLRIFADSIFADWTFTHFKFAYRTYANQKFADQKFADWIFTNWQISWSANILQPLVCIGGWQPDWQNSWSANIS